MNGYLIVKNLPNEKWKVSPYNKRTMISNKGRIKDIFLSENSVTYKEKLRNPYVHKNTGYKVYMSSPKFMYVHQIVGEVFLRKPRNNKAQINHKDGNKLNNNANNLEYTTCKENIRHAIKTKLIVHKKFKRLSSEQVEELKELKGKGVKLLELAKIFNINPRHVRKKTEGIIFNSLENN